MLWVPAADARCKKECFQCTAIVSGISRTAVFERRKGQVVAVHTTVSTQEVKVELDSEPAMEGFGRLMCTVHPNLNSIDLEELPGIVEIETN